MKEIENLKKDVREVHDLANEVARKANNELSIAKRKITCLTILVGLFAVLGTCIAFYSIHSFKELFYSMEIEEETIEYYQDVDQDTDGSGNNYFLNDSNNNRIGD